MGKNTPAFPSFLSQHGRQQRSLRYDALYCPFSSFRLEWATQQVQLTISSRAEGTAVGGKRTGYPQGRSNLGNLHGNGKEVQYVAILPVLSPTLYSNDLVEDSEVIYLRLLTTDFVVLNSPEVISDLTEKRSDIYSDRVSLRATLSQWC